VIPVRVNILYRDYLIDLRQLGRKGWRVAAISHSVKGASALPPTKYYSDQETAVRYAKEPIDARASMSAAGAGDVELWRAREGRQDN
jgi:hypothetical protein